MPQCIDRADGSAGIREGSSTKGVRNLERCGKGCCMTEERAVVFVIDDDASAREALESLVRSVRLDVRSFGSTREFLESSRPDAPACLVLDVRLPGASGLDFQHKIA